MERRAAMLTGLATLSAGGVAAAPSASAADAKAQVTAAELAFADSLARRDLAAFERLVSEEAVFMGSGGVPARGRAEVVGRWRRFFDADKPPFSWRPDQVEVLASATLAHSTGPVTGRDGQVFSRFYSIWRLEADGVWRVVFDNGYAVTPPAPAAPIAPTAP